MTATEREGCGSNPLSITMHSTDHHSMHTITQLGVAMEMYVPHSLKHCRLLRAQ